GSGGYPVTARSSTGGEAAGMLQLDVERILSRRQELQLALLASAVPTRAALRAVEVPVREVGRQLFTGLISGPGYGRYAAAATAAAQRGEPLRVVLRLRAPELAPLPWEMLFDPETGAYLCQREPLIRHVPVPAPPPPDIAPPLRLLGLVAAPQDLPALDAAGEKARLTEALTGLGGPVELTWAPGARGDDLMRILLVGHGHAVHLIGPGV